MIAQNSLLKYDPMLHVFLTYETEEFDEFKQPRKSLNSTEGSSIPLTSLKNLQLNDAFAYLYGSIKAKLFDTAEPEELQIGIKLNDILKQINEYTPFIEKSIESLENRLGFAKQCINFNTEINDYIKNANYNTDCKELVDIILNYQSNQSLLSSV
jgi:hypothetical protein